MLHGGYLGYWLGRKGRHKNDEHIKAQATQLRFKIRALRNTLGENQTMEYLNSYSAPSVLHGAELGSVSNVTLDTYHAWSLAEVLGIGRVLGEEAKQRA